jgi:hypothetical protein
MPANFTAAQWTRSDERLLVDYLHGHRAASGDRGNFKMATFQAAATVVEAKCMIGGLKTAKACQNKWAVVCPHLLFLFLFSQPFIALSCVSCHSGYHQPHGLELVQQKGWKHPA